MRGGGCSSCQLTKSSPPAIDIARDERIPVAAEGLIGLVASDKENVVQNMRKIVIEGS